MSRWSDDYLTPDERRAAWYTEVAIRHERAGEQAAQRHTGTDKGLHHWPEIINGPQWDEGAVLGDDPLDILGDQAVDQLTAYEAKKAEYAEQEREEARAWLDSHEIINRGPW